MTSIHHRSDSQVMASLYLYDPSLAAACVFIVLFSSTLTAHAIILYKRRTRFFIPFIVGIICEILGYVARAISAAQTPNWQVMPYALQSLMLLIAPSLLAASIYGMLGRLIILSNGQDYSPVKPKILTKVFITSDVLSFLVQNGGGGILTNAKSPSKIQLGENVIIVGLFIQLIGFALFIAVTAVFQWRISQERSQSLRHAASWEKFLWILYGVSALVLIRSLFRVIEYIQGYDGYLQTTEVFLYVFDAALIFLVTFILAVFHPSKVMTVDEDGNVISAEGSHELRSFVPLGTSSAQDLSASWAPKNTHEREYGGH
ncbi:RTA1-domain-containing protein [Colletotrichum scovillei]|uniref:RTA1-domain-containing protein n=1 Tax=Colletotrichum scovillei TaxID=1209932 RepID=A0A9P7QY85_9PEZI|nr:RTA1-domain-containing protein [Colletotrichum scovillei]KAG7043206.1 RTA1-domain-containing protein [Colletotrichum scovillei]KAG7062653.1 RTA1-domain-containing protein [Colletotrichum scovillei]